MTAAQINSWRAEFERLARPGTDTDTPGMVCGVMSGDESALYGFSYADREARTYVNPRETVFRAGSLSHLLTALAILQLAERGRLRLHEPIQKQIGDLPLPSGSDDAITPAHLLTTTDGLPERVGALFADTPQTRPLQEVLASRVGTLIARPGKAITRESWGVPLAAYLVQCAGGVPYPDYIQRNFFDALGMTHSVIGDPAQIGLPVAAAHYIDRGKLMRSEPLYSVTPAVDDFYTTGEDLLKLARVLLDIAAGKTRRGDYGDQGDQSAAMLQEEAIDGMFIRRFSNHVSLPGVTYGLHQIIADGVTGLAADGAGMNTRARLMLVPGDDAAMVVLMNAPDNLLMDDLTRAFLVNTGQGQRAARRPFTPPANFHYRGDRFAGAVRYMHNETTGAGKAYALFNGNIWITNNFNGTLTVVPQIDGDHLGGFTAPVNLTLLDDSVENALVFQREDNGGRVAFAENPNGLITALHAGSGNQATYQRVGLVDSSTFYLVIAGICLALFASGVLIWTFGVAINLASGNGSSWLIGTLGAVVSILQILWSATVVPVLRGMRSGLPRLMFQPDFTGWRRAALNLPAISAVLSIGLIIGALLAYQNDYWTDLARLHYLLLAIASVVFALIQLRWNIFRARDWYVHSISGTPETTQTT